MWTSRSNTLLHWFEVHHHRRKRPNQITPEAARFLLAGLGSGWGGFGHLFGFNARLVYLSSRFLEVHFCDSSLAKKGGVIFIFNREYTKMRSAGVSSMTG